MGYIPIDPVEELIKALAIMYGARWPEDFNVDSVNKARAYCNELITSEEIDSSHNQNEQKDFLK